MAFNKAPVYGASDLDPEERAIVLADDPRNRGRVMNVSKAANVAGGYMVPTIVMPTLLSKLKAFGGMRSVARILETDRGAPLAWPPNDDTLSTGELVAENAAATPGDLTFGVASLNAYKFARKIVPVSFEALQDAAADVDSIVLDALAMRIARSQNVYFTNGTGTGQPYGVAEAALG